MHAEEGPLEDTCYGFFKPGGGPTFTLGKAAVVDFLPITQI